MGVLYKLACKMYITISGGFDRRAGKEVDFAQWVSKEELNLAEKEGNQYMPSTFELRKVLKKLSISKDDCILDVGCGKGKAMYMMDAFPFKKIGGIDLSQELVDIANKNFEILKSEKCRAICCNALEFKDYHQYTMFYFYNPFPKEVFCQVIEKIVQSCEKNPRKITLIYMNPVCENEILKTGQFEEIYRRKSIISWFEIRCYSLK